MAVGSRVWENVTLGSLVLLACWHFLLMSLLHSYFLQRTRYCHSHWCCHRCCLPMSHHTPTISHSLLTLCICLVLLALEIAFGELQSTCYYSFRPISTNKPHSVHRMHTSISIANRSTAQWREKNFSIRMCVHVYVCVCEIFGNKRLGYDSRKRKR